MPPKAKAKEAAAQAKAEAAAAGVPVLSLCSSLGNSEFMPGTQLQSKECQCRAGVPPKARAKGEAAKARAKAVFFLPFFGREG